MSNVFWGHVVEWVFFFSVLHIFSNRITHSHSLPCCFHGPYFPTPPLSVRLCISLLEWLFKKQAQAWKMFVLLHLFQNIWNCHEKNMPSIVWFLSEGRKKSLGTITLSIWVQSRSAEPCLISTESPVGAQSSAEWPIKTQSRPMDPQLIWKLVRTNDYCDFGDG